MSPVIIVLIVVVVLLVLKYLFPFMRICGSSMYPTYKNDEVVLGTRIFNLKKIKVGDVLVYNMKENGQRKVVKRVANIKETDDGLFFYFVGDNKADSYDSRYYGFVPSSWVDVKLLVQRRCEE